MVSGSQVNTRQRVGIEAANLRVQQHGARRPPCLRQQPALHWQAEHRFHLWLNMHQRLLHLPH